MTLTLFQGLLTLLESHQVFLIRSILHSHITKYGPHIDYDGYIFMHTSPELNFIFIIRIKYGQTDV